MKIARYHMFMLYRYVHFLFWSSVFLINIFNLKKMPIFIYNSGYSSHLEHLANPKSAVRLQGY